MKSRTLSFLLALVLSAVVCATSYVITRNWTGTLLLSVITLASGFVLIGVGIERYLARRIRLVYKLISNLKIDKDLKEALGNSLSDDALDLVEQDVIQWARQQSLDYETLRKISEYRKEFLGNLSHEIKTPLFNIQGYVQSLLDGGMEDEDTAKLFLLKAEKNIDRLCALVADVDVMAKLDTGEMPLNRTVFDVVALFKEVAFTLDEKAKAKQIQFDFHLPERRMVEADKEKITQVITNLLDNSIKYGKAQGTTTIKCFDMDKQVLLEITDNGMGIDEEHIPRLFERFYRVDKSRKSQEGSGIGLAIVKHILNAHQQAINVRSTKNVGTTFAFTLQKASRNS